MKRAVALGIGLLALTSTSFVAGAADLGAPSIARAPVLAPTPVSSWSGFYAGIGLGGRWAQTDWQTTCLNPAANGTCPGNLLFADRLVDNIGDNPIGFELVSPRASGYLGYNWQIANWVLGVEGDFGWADSKHSLVGIPGTHLGFGFAPFGGDRAAVRDRWDASIRGRAGYVFAGTSLLYLTGGATFLDEEVSASCAAGSFAAGGWCTLAHAETFSKTLFGWTVGAGLEWMFMPSWIARFEFRHADYAIDRTHIRFFGAAGAVDTFDAVIDQRAEIFYVGLSHLFNWASPVIAKY